MSTNDYTVYKLTHLDGRVYIGMTRQTLSKRCRKNGYDRCPAMGKAVRKYGWESFLLSVVADNLTKDEAELIEKENISLYDSTNPSKGFNVALGGNIPGRHSHATREQMSESQKGRQFSEDHLTKLHKPKLNGALRRTVIQYDEKGNFLCEHPSIYDAVKSVNGWKEGIIRCCNHQQRLHKGFMWEYGKGGAGI